MHRSTFLSWPAVRLALAGPVAAGLALATAAAAAPVPAAQAATTTTTTCLVVDTNSDQSYTDPQALQTAVTAAASGDTLFVKGTCSGNVSIGKNLTISGQSSSGQKTATLNGQNSELDVNSATVTLNTLYITDGFGLANGTGTLTLNDSTVTGATADIGAGITNDGTLILNGSTVTGNTATRVGGGGGIFSVGPPGLLVNAIAPPAANPNVFSNTPDNIDILNVPCG